MAEISKPDYRYVWASGGANVLPSTTKIQTGWTSEVPPFQWENALQNRQDNMLVHINQHGLPQWDALTEYFANKSYTLGSDGLVYKAVQNSGPNTTAQDPTTDVSDTYWRLAFADAAQNYITQTTGDARYLQRSNNLSDITNAATARNNLGIVPTTRVTRISSPIVQAVSGASTSPQTYTPLSYSFTGDGSMYIIRVKLNANIQTDTGTGPSNAVVFKLLNGATPLDISAANITGTASWQGDCFVLEWSGTLSGTVNLTVTFEKTYASGIGSLSINGDRDDLTSNVSGQTSTIDIFKLGN